MMSSSQQSHLVQVNDVRQAVPVKRLADLLETRSYVGLIDGGMLSGAANTPGTDTIDVLLEPAVAGLE